MLQRLTAFILVLVPLVVLLGCENDLLEPDVRGAIQGQVLDFETRAPLDGVGITTSPPTGALVTDAEGRFRIDNLPVGNYTVSGRLSEYNPNTVAVSVREGEITPAILFLEEGAEEDTTSSPADVDVSVLNFYNQVRSDSASVVVQYRVRNTGEVDIPAYEAYFQLLTTGQTYFKEVSGTNLGVGQADIGEFVQYVGRDSVTAVQVSDIYFEGQEL